MSTARDELSKKRKERLLARGKRGIGIVAEQLLNTNNCHRPQTISFDTHETYQRSSDQPAESQPLSKELEEEEGNETGLKEGSHAEGADVFERYQKVKEFEIKKVEHGF